MVEVSGMEWDNHPIPPPRRVSIQADDPPLMPHSAVCCLPAATAVAHAAYPLACSVHDGAQSSFHTRTCPCVVGVDATRFSRINGQSRQVRWKVQEWMDPLSWTEAHPPTHGYCCVHPCPHPRRRSLLQVATCVHASPRVSSRLQVGAYVCLHG